MQATNSGTLFSSKGDVTMPTKDKYSTCCNLATHSVTSANNNDDCMSRAKCERASCPGAARSHFMLWMRSSRPPVIQDKFFFFFRFALFEMLRVK
jgi:hypothetical protein